MNKSLGFVASLVPLPGAVLAVSAPGCVRVNKAQIEALFDKWNESLKTGNVQTVSENYLSDAVLLLTVSSKARLMDAERVDYFEHFFAKKPIRKTDMRTIRLGHNKAIDTGTYTFTFTDKSTASARYTFTYAQDGKEWKVSTHHSSVIPEG